MTSPPEISRRMALAAGLAGAAMPAVAALPPRGRRPRADTIDDAIRRYIDALEIPGVGVALIAPGRPLIARGYGVRRLGDPTPVDADTRFAIASNSKAFLAAAIAMLVEEGKLGWDRPVTAYMPDFAMSDPAVTAMMTVRDLLCHRSGLPLGAGDLMQFPASDHSRADLLHGLRFLKLARGFRAGYDYDNILYVVAGILVERVSGTGWEDFLATRLFRPLGMTNSLANRSLLRTDNVAARHARLGPPTRGLGRLEPVEPDETPTSAPAGGVQTSAGDILSWLAIQLGQGAMRGGRRLWSEASAAAMWTPQVITASSTGPTPTLPVRPVLSSYALGWFVSDFRGHRMVSHGGALTGQTSQIALLPELGIALAVFTNNENRLPTAGLRNALLDHLLGLDAVDWIANTKQLLAEEADAALKQVSAGDFAAPPGGPSLPLARYAGRYRDPWYGDIVVASDARGLSIDFTRTPVFKSALERFGPDAFRTRLPKGVGEDAVVRFVIEKGVPVRLTLEALSPLADFSFDFHDLAPERVA